MQLIACQYDIQWEDREANFNAIRQLLSSIQIRARALIIFPEMFSSGFSMNVDRIAESTPSQAEAFLKELAETYQAWVLGGLVFKHSDGLGSNELSVFNPEGQLIGHYQKNHCFSYTAESDYYENGEDILLFEWGGFIVCPSICYDLRFPELYRRGVKAGANLFPVIANWPDSRAKHWTTLLEARAIENQAFVVGVNRTGKDRKWTYPGLLVVYGPKGEEVAIAGDQPSCLIADIDPDIAKKWRDEFRALGDMKL
ncbi:MAG: nitrilase-related carbon-nitrogen hydrolase [Verrucomicrobiota bacterium]|nr:nitrilase-related carbon-nitrogen hydrolase [Verrucomicrobiota bacterium]